jgi:hypothetical protein
LYRAPVKTCAAKELVHRVNLRFQEKNGTFSNLMYFQEQNVTVSTLPSFKFWDLVLTTRPATTLLIG